MMDTIESYEKPKPPERRPRLKRVGFIDESIRTVLFIIAVTILFDMGIPRSLVDGRSMQPTFQDGERLIVSRIHYLLFEPERGQIVVFNSLNPREEGVMLIKRVVGLPGESVAFRDGAVYIDDQQVDEPYTLEMCRTFRCPDQEYELAPDEYFMMGDNRNNSQDSRRFGPVPHDHLVGMVLFRYWPPQRLGLILGHEYGIDA